MERGKVLESALKYARFGWHVFPVSQKTKRALISEWQHKATTEPQQIISWWGQWRNANIGVLTGKSNLAIVDIDTKNGIDGHENWLDLIAELELGPQDTVQSSTPSGGTHVFYRCTDDVGNGRVAALGDCLDIRAGRSYAILPPSQSPTGDYVWETSPTEGELALLPNKIKEILVADKTKRVAAPMPDMIPEGQRNAQLTSLAGSMRQRGAAEASILAALVEENMRCEQPLGTDELRTIAKSVARYEPNKAPVWMVGQAEFVEGKTFIPPRLGRHILAHVPFLNLTKEKTAGHLYSYSNGAYLKDGAARVAELGGELLRDAYRDNRIEETTRWIEMQTRTDPAKANQHQGLINVKNGMLNWKTGELLPHDPEYHSTIQIPVNYDPDAHCPEINTFLLTTLPGDCIELALEWIGYLLIPTTKYQKVMITVGAGANGKSTFLDLIKAFVGKANASGIPLQELSEHRFKRAELQGKLINVFADLSAKALESSSYFKMIVSGDEIDAEKKYGHPFKFDPFCRLVFSANKMPSAYDKSKAFYRRWLIVPFPNSFEGDAADRDILAKLTVQQELSGLLNLAIRYLRVLTERGRFDEPETVTKAMVEYKQGSDPMTAFLDEFCYTSDAEILQVSKKALYEAYTDFCQTGKARWTEPRAEFNTRLKEMYPTMIETRKRVDGSSIRFWSGGPGMLKSGDE